MEELRPVPPAPKKKPSLLFRLLAFLLTLALLLGAVAAVVYRDKLNFDGIRRWFTYRALERSDSGQAESFRYESSGRGGFCPCGRRFLPPDGWSRWRKAPAAWRRPLFPAARRAWRWWCRGNRSARGWRFCSKTMACAR